MNSLSAAENIQAPAAVQTAREKRRFWGFLLFALVYLGLGIGLRDPWPSDEPRFTLAAQQMVESGDWMFPHRGSELYPDKPPMLMWMEAATYEVVRNWRIAFLMPSLLAALLTLALTYDLGRRFWNPRAGLYAACALLAVFQFVYQCKRAQIDPLEMGWITLANWGLLLHFLRGPNWRAYWLACFAAGLGVITKGVGFLALLMFVPYLWARLRGWDGVTRTSHATLRWLGGALAFSAAIALWLVPMLLSAQARAAPEYHEYVNNILLHQTAQRYAGTWSHPQPFWYFLPIVLFNWFPLSLAYPVAIPRWWRAIRDGDARIMLPLIWGLLLLVFFSIPVGKRDVYVMPVLPMVALALAPYLEGILDKAWLRIGAFAIALIAGLVFIAGGIWALRGAPAAVDLVQRRGLPEGGLALWWMVLAIGIAMLVAAAWFRPRRGVYALLSGTAALWVIWSLWAYPLLNDSSSSAGVMRRAGQLIGADGELALVGWREQNLLMADRPVSEFGFLVPPDQQFVQAVKWQAESPERRWIFSLDQAMGECVDLRRATRVGQANRRDWWLFRADAVKPGCVPVIAPEDPSRDTGF
jgi:4-amino-4-deoxy-L-arabinose transferase-like glycosyltransferase